MARSTKFGGFVSGKPTKQFSTYTNLGQLVQEMLQAERKLKEDCDMVQMSPVVEKIQKENPPEVKDKTKQESSLAKHKDIKPVGAPKSSVKEPKYTKLSNFIPVEVSRNENEKAKITGKFDEDLQEEEEASETPDPRHVVSEISRHMSKKIGKAMHRSAWGSGKKYNDPFEKDKEKEKSNSTEKPEAKKEATNNFTVIKPEDKDQYSRDTFKQGSAAAKRLSAKKKGWKSASELQMDKDKEKKNENKR